MPAADVHPAPHDLEAFTLGTLDDASHASVESHLAGCAACQARAAEAPADALVELLRSAHRHAAGDTPIGAAADTACAERPGPEVPAELAEHPRYRLLRPLGAGGMGTVWLAEHRVMGRRVALKVIRPEHLARPGAAERFRREAHAAARLHHPSIVAAHDAEQAGATHFLVMEYVAGVSLAEHLARTGPLPVAEACEY
ncbi:MAG TPA: protein kinase, partial [Gemmataceae bacterium]|nr:protein kinase [Gemmataceae bacterium]